MKKNLLLLVLFLIPFGVHANIVCNDGTVSPSCYDCHKGCCSKHGGCSNSANQVSEKKNSNSNNNTTKITTTTITTLVTTTEASTTTTITTTTTTTTKKTTKYIEIDDDEDVEADETSDEVGEIISGLVILSVGGVIAYKKLKK